MHKHCGRPDNFEGKILNRLRNNVRRGDVVICLGDVCRGADERWNQLLTEAIRGRGAKAILTLGNHDQKSLQFYTENGWDFVCELFMLHRYGYYVFFSHAPMVIPEIWQGENFVNIHGHQHNTNHHEECVTTDNHLLVYMEHHYNPLPLKYLIDIHRSGNKFKAP
jgi:calcineurin-like phosphoesterase family protein